MLANAQRQDLVEHSLAVALVAQELLGLLEVNERARGEIEVPLIHASLHHDIGKCEPRSQDYYHYLIKKKRSGREYTGLVDAEGDRFLKGGPAHNSKAIPFHNEISWAFVCAQHDLGWDDGNDLTQYAIYWHHPANVDEKGEFRFQSHRDIRNKVWGGMHDDLTRFSSDLIERWNASFYPKLEIATGHPSEINDRPKFVETNDHYRVDLAAKRTLVRAILIEADRIVSMKYSAEELSSFVMKREKGESIAAIDLERYYRQENELKELPIDAEDSRSLAQRNLSKIMANHPGRQVVCGGDPGVGKTIIAYRAHFLANQKRMHRRRLIIALPKQRQVTSFFQTICKDLKRCFSGCEEVSIDAVFDGQRQHQIRMKPEDPLLSGDIGIVVFDRLLSPCYEARQFDELIALLMSDIVIDEFHELSMLPEMLTPLREILYIRNLCNHDGKVFFLSGTPDPALCKFLEISDEDRLARTLLPPLYPDERTFFRLSDGIDVTTTSVDSLISFNKIEDAQKAFALAKDGARLVHSNFASIDLSILINEILAYFSNPHPQEKMNRIFTSHMLDSSFNIHVKNLYTEIFHPNSNAQQWGRKNRFGGKGGGEVVLARYSDESIFHVDKAGYKKLVQAWQEHLRDRIGDGLWLSHREAIEQLYDSFWQDPHHVAVAAGELAHLVEKRKKRIETWFPRRIIKRYKQDIDKKVRSFAGRFRGASRLLSAKRVDGINPPQLLESLLITVSAYWRIDILNTATQTAARSMITSLRNVDGLEFNKYRRNFGFDETSPLLCSCIEPKVDVLLKGVLEASRLYLVYHKEYGLVDEAILSGKEKCEQ